MARPTSQRVNLSTIAERLGVSVATVSRALRGMNGIHPETEARIVGLAHEMGYHARSGAIRTQQNAAETALRHVLVLSQSTSPDVDQRYMAGMSGAAVGFNVAILSHLVARDQCATVLDQRLGPASLRGGLVKGAIVIHRWPTEVVSEICAKFPVVSIVHDYPGTEADLIGIDDRRGMAELVHHLHAGGHRRIGFFGLCPEVSWSSARYAAYIETLTRLDLAIDPRDVVRISLEQALSSEEFSSAPWAQAIETRRRAGVDAWVCASSMTGRTLCRFFVNRGLSIPRDVALVSYHGGSYPKANDLPAITTTDVIDEELGAAAVRRLINRLDHPGESRRSILIPARLAVGETTRVPVGAGCAAPSPGRR
ncbi:MAG: LacI family transcriptional regulator [Opitutaceae bacterium]|jgi:LacI family transcriptional regulator|nr:LacI family transcriptional regulator [Opitutaceae bacterium]